MIRAALAVLGYVYVFYMCAFAGLVLGPDSWVFPATRFVFSLHN